MINTILLVFLNWVAFSGAPAVADSKPLPELDAFLRGVRERLHGDRVLLSHYTYTEKSILRQLDSDGRATKTETRVYEVYPSIEEKMAYRRLISRNDEPLSAEDIAKSDRAYDKKRGKWDRRLEQENVDEKQRREAKEMEAKHKEEETVDEVFHLYRFTMIGREQLDDIPVIAIAFEPDPLYKPKGRDAKILSKVRGKAWFCEADQQLVRIEAELVKNLSFGLGTIVKLNKGTHMIFQRRRVNNEVWLPAESRFTGTGRVLIFKGFRIDQETFYSDYHKFSVDTSIRFSGPDRGIKE
jgi:hypothetical protein